MTINKCCGADCLYEHDECAGPCEGDTECVDSAFWSDVPNASDVHCCRAHANAIGRIFESIPDDGTGRVGYPELSDKELVLRSIRSRPTTIRAWSR